MQRHKHLLTQKLHNRITPDDEDTCERFPNTHYDATSTFGEVKLYDSAMFHRGLANTGEMDEQARSFHIKGPLVCCRGPADPAPT